MEPMTLGSPTHSPSGSPNVAYLPPYLLGEINAPATPRINSLSPTKGRNLAFGSPTSPTQYHPGDQASYRHNMSMQQQHALYNQQNLYSNMTSPNISYSNKPNGPPIEDLFDTIKSNESVIGYGNENSFMQNSFHANNHNQSLNNHWQDECQEFDKYWVTVFGFPSNAANTVLARFSNCGAILDKQYPTQGNWAHIRYATRAEKERAMTLNGRTVLPGVMVGVIDCKEPPRSSVNNTSNTLERHPVAARSLCPTPVASAPVPQKSNGLVSKTLEFFLSW